MADLDEGWWLLECGHYAHSPDDRRPGGGTLICRTCKALSTSMSAGRRPVKHLDDYVIQEV